MQPEPQLQTVARNAIERDESLLWLGRPDAKRMLLRIQNLFTVAFGVVWTVNAVSFIQRWPNPDLPFHLFMGSFVVIGVTMMLSPLWIYWQGLRTIYVVTDKRILILINGVSPRVESYGGIDVNALKRTERADGTGDLVVANRLQTSSDGPSREVDVTLFGIADVRSVERLVKATFSKPGAP